MMKRRFLRAASGVGAEQSAARLRFESEINFTVVEGAFLLVGQPDGAR